MIKVKANNQMITFFSKQIYVGYKENFKMTVGEN